MIGLPSPWQELAEMASRRQCSPSCRERSFVPRSDKSDPSKAISDLNSQINQHGHGTNLACFYALLDPVNHTLEYVNAGFNPPFIVDPGGMVDTLGGGGIALGMLDKMELQETLHTHSAGGCHGHVFEWRC